jgi:hypothetical protein
MLDDETLCNVLFYTIDEIHRNGGVNFLEIRKIASVFTKDTLHAQNHITKALRELDYKWRKEVGVAPDYRNKGVYFETEKGFWNYCFLHRADQSIADAKAIRRKYMYRKSKSSK